MSLAYLS
ncbi:hypothetical protein VTH06DRAFT_1624 [Thermothelomyces fergusii]